MRGIIVGDIIYGLPCHADCLLRIDTRTDEVGVIEIPYEDYFDTSIPENGDETQTEAYLERHSPWKYHGGAISPHDKCIYAIPQYSKKVLRFNPVTEECSFVGPKFEGRCKFWLLRNFVGCRSLALQKSLAEKPCSWCRVIGLTVFSRKYLILHLLKYVE